MMTTVSIIVNGRVVTDDVEADTTLLEFLRSHGCPSVKCGCETTNCGLCTVWLDNKPTLSCAVLSVRADGREVTTLEGVIEESRAFARSMAEQGAEQCGFCSPGLVMSVLALKRELAGRVPTDEEIRAYLAGNLCRCTGYMSQMRAIRHFLGATVPDGTAPVGPDVSPGALAAEAAASESAFAVGVSTSESAPVDGAACEGVA